MVAPRVLLRHPHRLLPLSPSHPTALAPTARSFFTPPRRICCPCARGGARPSWGSNAEGAAWPGRFRFRDAGGGAGKREEAEEGEGWRKGKRRWWSDDDPYDAEWDDDDVEGSDLLDDDALEQPWEKIWIFKVFKSYGYLLPAIIASMLLANGPKAFLMALALPLGQSAVSLAIDKLWGNANKGTRSKSKRKPFARSSSDFRRKEEEGTNGVYQRKEAYQSWMATDAVASDREGNSHAFGGWDELDTGREYAKGPARQERSKTTSTSSSRAQSIKKGKLSRGERRKEMPLFLRLLIAVFPFLGSWTRIL